MVTLRDGVRHLHAAELEAVGVGLVVGRQVVIVEDTDTEDSGVHTGTQEEDGDEARHLVDRGDTVTLRMADVGVPGSKSVPASHLDVQVVVVSLCQLDEDGEQGQDGPGAEEGAFRPDHGYAEQAQDHGQQPVEPALQETLPVPL